MNSYKYLTFVVIANIFGAFFVGCGTTKPKATNQKPEVDAVAQKAAALEDLASLELDGKKIDGKKAEQFYQSGFRSVKTLSELNPTMVLVKLYQVDEKATADQARAISAAAKQEVDARAEIARQKAADKEAKAVTAFTGAGISEGNATRVYKDEEKGFQSFGALSKASADDLISAGLADDPVGAAILIESIDKEVLRRGRAEASRLEALAAQRVREHKTAKALRDENKETHEAAQKASEKAKAAKAKAEAKAKDAEAAEAAAVEAAKARGIVFEQKAPILPPKLEEKQ